MKKRTENILLGLCLVLLIASTALRTSSEPTARTEIHPSRVEMVATTFDFPVLDVIQLHASPAADNFSNPAPAVKAPRVDADECTATMAKAFQPVVPYFVRSQLHSSNDEDPYPCESTAITSGAGAAESERTYCLNRSYTGTGLRVSHKSRA